MKHLSQTESYEITSCRLHHKLNDFYPWKPALCKWLEIINTGLKWFIEIEKLRVPQQVGSREHQCTGKRKKQSTLTSKTVMAYFNTRSTTEVIVYASPIGLAAILTQKKSIDNNPKIIAYASRSLTDVERRYSQTEKEGLAIVCDVIISTYI